jgi:hypothetical protein
MITSIKQLGINLPSLEQLASLPYFSTARTISNGTSSRLISDGYRYIYWIAGGVQFWRYDTFSNGWQRRVHLWSGSGAFTTGTPMASYCYTRDIIYLATFGTSATTFYEHNCKLDRMRQLANLPAATSGGACLCHTCSEENSAGDDDKVYYVRGTADNTLRVYSISGNSFSNLAVLPSAMDNSTNGNMFWISGEDTDRLFILRGTTGNFFIYSISGNSYDYSAIQSINNCSVGNPAGFPPNGSFSCYNPHNNSFYFLNSGAYSLTSINRHRQILKMKLGNYDTGTATSSTNTTLADSSKNWLSNSFVGFTIEITGGTGATQIRKIVSNTATALTINTTWSVNPDATSTYALTVNNSDWGTATAGGANTLTDSWATSPSSPYSAFSYGTRISIIGGTGAGQERIISTHTATVLTVSQNWTVNPDNTSIYKIHAPRPIPVATIPFEDSNSSNYASNTLTTMRIQGLDYVYFIRNGSAGEWFRFHDITP